MTVNLGAIKERLAAVPPPPWGEFCESGDWWIQQKDADGSPVGESICNSDPEDMRADVATFVEHAPQDITDLLAEVDRLAKERDAWERRARDLESLCSDRL